ncbi:MAG: hypothetical protein KDE47_26875 [Caldilineaceae bacterium]|nr:hypothetical protein [Caldilineaceae bacterium]MCB0189411.1 hypothetical protein [Caldilineaceae bacterium]
MSNEYEWATDPKWVQETMAGWDMSKPVGMLNLLKFRRYAKYASDTNELPCSGAEAYSRYAVLIKPMLDAIGAKVTHSEYLTMLGPPDEWDRAFIVRYEHASDLVNLTQNPDYHLVAPHRTAALADTRLVMMDFDDSGLF